MKIEGKRFAKGAVATPHYLASAVGLGVLADGGNAVDAIIAANLALGVVAPYFCGYGGDLFAIVYDGRRSDAAPLGYRSAGRSPAAATVDGVRAASGSDTMPIVGAHTVTVPGAVRGWFELLERFGTRSFADLCGPRSSTRATGSRSPDGARTPSRARGGCTSTSTAPQPTPAASTTSRPATAVP